MTNSLFKKSNVNSIVIALLLCANPITWVLQFSNVIVVIIIAALLIAMFNNGIMFLFDTKKILLSLSMILFLCVSMLIEPKNEYVVLYFYEFLVFGIPALFISSLKFSKKALYYSIALLSFVMLPFISSIDFGNSAFDKVDYGFWMGISYGLLRFILPLLLCVFFIKRLAIRFLLVLVSLFYIFTLLKYGSRGTLLSIVFFLVVFYFINRGLSLRQGLKFVFIGTFLLIGLQIYLTANSDTFFFLRKTESLGGGGDLSNGRGQLFSKAIDGIIEKPFYGNGIGAFEYLHGTYPHNFLLHMSYEGGIFYSMFFLLILLTCIYNCFKGKVSKENLIYLLLLFSISIMELLFSSIYWRSQVFWLFIGFVISKKYLNNESSD
ncbi:O-antigen ligase family protein [Myroides odoratimimus]|uniref:O-antigen ligase family protein n=1 Tax=Myroides odoratimimus TaxID=76832 RepID=UPI0025776905|nr:O-antigen ligase family protein [Myroides odoratimimus]MDM1447992.1 O-antigen ligase family protein [Myroides odoratimimus]